MSNALSKKIPYRFFHCDPENFDSLYNTQRSETELRQLLAFSIAVAGKHAKGTANAVDRLLELGDKCYNCVDPFGIIGAYYTQFHLKDTATLLQNLGFGCYTSRAKYFVDMFYRLTTSGMTYTHLNLSTCTVDDLELCQGIGPKTARFFLLYTRENQRLAALDTHIWKVVRDNFPDAPAKIPSTKKQYKFWEAKFLSLLNTKKYSHLNPVTFDFYGWDGKRKGTI